jgi:hypothetical protein
MLWVVPKIGPRITMSRVAMRGINARGIPAPRVAMLRVSMCRVVVGDRVGRLSVAMITFSMDGLLLALELHLPVKHALFDCGLELFELLLNRLVQLLLLMLGMMAVGDLASQVLMTGAGARAACIVVMAVTPIRGVIVMIVIVVVVIGAKVSA